MTATGVAGVIGAGTMGQGIAQLALTAGARTVLVDPDPDACERAVAGISAGLEKLVSKGRLRTRLRTSRARG